MSEIESLKARVVELEAQLGAAVEETRRLEGSIVGAVSMLRLLQRYTRPDVAREAIVNSTGCLAGWPTDHRIWSHVTPTYKVAECIEQALTELGAGR